MRRSRGSFNGCRYNARMQIQLNGEPREIAPGITLGQLLEREGLAGRRVAVEVNLEIVPRSLHGQRALADGDRVEVVQAIGGG
jgi:sulfur carrier protein